VTVQRSKGRSRILPIRDDLVAELRHYLRRRDEILAASGVATSPALFVRRDGSALTVRAAWDVLCRLLRDLGLKPPRGRTGARSYELRHNSESRIIPSTASNDAVLPEEAGWEGSERCSE
jgi:site-specific recombinase XerD